MIRVSAVALLAVAFTSCVPWTVRPLDSGGGAAEAAAILNPAGYVDSIWSTKLLPAIGNSAVDARTFLDAWGKSPADTLARFGRSEPAGPVFLSVKGSGRVLTVDTRSRVGLALVDVPPFDGKPDVTIQIGPVLRGTSLRDATGLVRFTDFVNQLQFADVANELNNRVLKTVLAPIQVTGLGGRNVSFLGTANGDLTSTPPVRELVPIQLVVQEGQ